LSDVDDIKNNIPFDSELTVVLIKISEIHLQTVIIPDSPVELLIILLSFSSLSTSTII